MLGHHLPKAGLAAAMLILSAAISVAAEKQFDARLITDKWYLSAGSSLNDYTTEAAIGFGNILGTFIRLEDDLELDSSQSILRINGFYAFNRRHMIDFTFGRTSRDSTTIIDEEITIGDDGEEVVFQVGAEIATEFDSDSAKILYKYSFANTGRLQAGIGAGLSIFDYKLKLNGEALIDDGMGGQMLADEAVSEGIVAPIPSFLIFINYAIKPKFIFRTHAGIFDLSVGDYEGRLIESRLTLDYFFNNLVGVGGGIEGSDIDFKDRGDDPLLITVKQTAVVGYVGFVF